MCNISKLNFIQVWKKNKIKKNETIKIGTKIFIIVNIAWPIIHFLIFWLYVNFDTILLSFQRFSINKGRYVFIGLKNFNELIRFFGGYPNSTLIDATLNSLSLFLFSNFLLLPISIICGYVLYKKVIFSSFFRVVFYFPSIISMVVLTMCFKFSFDSQFGIITKLFKILNIDSIIPKFGWFSNVKTAWGMILTYSLWAGIGYNVLLLTGSFNRIPNDIIESSLIDGIGFWKELFYIAFPLIGSTINTLIVIGTTSVLTTFLQSQLLTGGGPNNKTYTIMFYITAMVKQGTNGVCSAATLGVFVSIIAIPLILFMRKILDKLLPSIEF